MLLVYLISQHLDIIGMNEIWDTWDYDDDWFDVK
jgi:hypothetical protein